MDKNNPLYHDEIIRHNARMEVEDEWEEKEKKKKKRKKRKYVLLTIFAYLILLYTLYMAANQFADFKLF